MSSGCLTRLRSFEARLSILAIVVSVALVALSAGSAERSDDPWEDAEVMVVMGDGNRGSLIEAPSSVVSFDSQELLAAGITDVGDLSEYTPNLEINSVFGASSPEIFIRGVGLKDTNANATSSVAVVSDGVYLNSPVGQLAQFFDVEAVNVLRGPQGSQYGRNASAGAILIQSARPSGEFGSRLALTYGRFDQVEFEGYAEAPIVRDRLAMRVSGRLRKRDPYGINRAAPGRQTPIRNSLNGPPEYGTNDRDDWAARGQLLFTPLSGLEILLNVHGGQNRSLAPSFQYGAWLPPNRFNPLWHGSNGYFDFDGCTRLDSRGRCVENKREPENGNPLNGAYNATPPEDLDLFGTYLKVDREIGRWSFMSLTAFERNSRDAGLDLDASPRGSSERTVDDEAWQISQELRVNWSNLDRLDVTAGIFALHEHLEGTNFFGAGTRRLGQDFEQSTDYLGVFGVGHIYFDERFSIEVGLRLNVERKEFSLVAFNRFVFGDVILESRPGLNLLLESTESFDVVPSGEIIFEYAATSDVRFYSKYVRGYKGRHINAGGVDPNTVVDPSDPEFVNSFELGFSTEWLDGIVSWNGASFLYIYEGQQVFQSLTQEGGSQPVDQLINAEDSRIFGVESELRLHWGGLKSYVAIGWLYSEYSDFRNVRISFSDGGDR